MPIKPRCSAFGDLINTRRGMPDLGLKMDTLAASAVGGNFIGNPVLPTAYMMAQPDGQNPASRNINGDSISIVDDAHFELPLYSTTETSWYSSSSEEIDALYQLDPCNISHVHNLAPQSSMYRQSAFGSYLRPCTESLHFKNGRQNQMKRCFKLLRKIDEKRRDAQRLSQATNIEEQHEFDASFQNKAAFHHMIAERNRRVKLKQHFSLLHSLLPHNTKRDKYSVLSNTFKHMCELKRQVDELEQRNRALEESLRINISKKEGCSGFDQRHEEHQATLVYSSDEVVLEQSKNMPNQLDMRINIQIDPLSSPTSLIIILLERLRELQLEVTTVQSNIQTFKFQAHLLLSIIKGDQWERFKWENVVEVVRSTFAVKE